MASSPELPSGTAEILLRHRDLDRSYFLHTPGPDASDPAPLVLVLHGRGIPPLMFDRWTGYSALSDKKEFLLAMPVAVGEVWNDGRYRGPSWKEVEAVDDVGFLHGVIDDVRGRHAVNPSAIYVVGMSNGAAMAGRVAWERPGRISALAQISGTAAAAVIVGDGPGVPVPILQMHGTRDRWAPYAGGRARGLVARLVLWRPGGPSLGVDEWARRWVVHNHATQGPMIETLEPGISIRHWRGQSPSADVVFYRIDGGGHTWPGARGWIPPHLGRATPTLNATRISWEFLSAHRNAA
jgi:polyhydroxybutyrate depolymerase